MSTYAQGEFGGAAGRPAGWLAGLSVEIESRTGMDCERSSLALATVFQDREAVKADCKQSELHMRDPNCNNKTGPAGLGGSQRPRQPFGPRLTKRSRGVKRVAERFVRSFAVQRSGFRFCAGARDRRTPNQRGRAPDRPILSHPTPGRLSWRSLLTYPNPLVVATSS